MSNPYDSFEGQLVTSPFAATASGTNTVLAAPATGKHRVIHGYELSASGAVEAQFAAGSTNSTVSGTYYLAAKQYVNREISPYPKVTQLAAGTALLLDLSGATPVSGTITYREITMV